MALALACMDDLMFLSKIMEAAKALSVPLRSLKTAEKLIAACRESDRAVVFLDLDDPRLDAIALARTIRAAEPRVEAAIYAFVSHLNEGRIEAAGVELFDQIFSRGQFVRVLPELLTATATPRPPESPR
jgi:DNA-binding NarL/FixJ family response regulator